MPTKNKSSTQKSFYILGMRVDATSYDDATKKIIHWANTKLSSYVCVANVHMTMEAYDSPKFAKTINESALTTPDGMPLVWGLKAFGEKNASRVYGPTLTLHVCRAAAHEGIPIALYGGTQESLTAFVEFLHKSFPAIEVVCQIAPPFRQLTPEEDATYSHKIIESGARIVFVGIGCPKQELWMAKHKGLIPAVMIGVGAAFDFHSGRVQQAPNWMQKIGLEWLFRLSREPKRLWKRYLFHNPRFLFLFLLQWLRYLFDLKEPKVPHKS
jgi:N-acetylglucosaminyldiphosphoundecaprenol N-acetyl-beta-D-mannosaminyltransferase